MVDWQTLIATDKKLHLPPINLRVRKSSVPKEPDLVKCAYALLLCNTSVRKVHQRSNLRHRCLDDLHEAQENKGRCNREDVSKYFSRGLSALKMF